MTEYEEIIKWYPHLVLVSENPAIWHGFLTINNSIQMDIKLTVPNYPQLNDASINFGNKIYLTYGTDFANKVASLLSNSSSVTSLLNKLQRLLDSTIKPQSVTYNLNGNWSPNINIKELQTVLSIPYITVCAKRDLSVIKLTCRDISISLNRNPTGNRPWSVLSSDLPELKNWQPLESCIPTLNEAAEVLKTRVDELQDTWFELNDIDNNCWVIEPVDPQPQHMHRRIYLSTTLSILLTLDPTNPDSPQHIQVLGSDTDASKCRETIDENLKDWNSDLSLKENLLKLLNLHELPRRPVGQPTQDLDAGLVLDSECGICFCTDSDEEEYPSLICNNEKCQKKFHRLCLLKWLQSIAGNKIVYQRVHGRCPHCKENISCFITSK